MNISRTLQAGVHVLALEGELTGADDALVAQALECLDRRGAALVLDLAGLQYLNSAGIGQLVRVVAQANTQECRVILAGPRASIAGVFEVTHLDHFFQIAADVPTALRQLTA